MEAYKKWVAKSAAVTALCCVLELNVNVPMKVRHVSEHNVWFLRRSLPSHCRSLWPARSAHSVVGKGAEEADRCSGVKAGSKPAVANHKWNLRLGVLLPQVLYAFDFFDFPSAAYIPAGFMQGLLLQYGPSRAHEFACVEGWTKKYIWLFNGTSCSHQSYRSLSQGFKRTFP